MQEIPTHAETVELFDWEATVNLLQLYGSEHSLTIVLWKDSLEKRDLFMKHHPSSSILPTPSRPTL